MYQNIMIVGFIIGILLSLFGFVKTIFTKSLYWRHPDYLVREREKDAYFCLSLFSLPICLIITCLIIASIEVISHIV